MRRLASLLCFFSLSALAVTLPEARTECVDVAEPLPWKYCKTTTVGSRNPDVLYHFHGRGGNATHWTDNNYYTTLVRKEWARGRRQAPTVVSVSFGPVWLLVEKNQSPSSGLFEVFTKVVLPTVEKTLRPFSGRRLLVGESMGGFNASQVALKAGGLFAKVAILCPPMVSLTPWATQEQIDEFIAKHKAKPQLVAEMIQLSQYFMPTLADWQKASPMDLAKTNLGPRSPSLYVSCGLYDEFGFFAGSEAFAETGAKRGARVHWRPLYGGHCAVDAVSLAAFLR
jgi:S-formylglutathione hydrolase FrmB